MVPMVSSSEEAPLLGPTHRFEPFAVNSPTKQIPHQQLIPRLQPIRDDFGDGGYSGGGGGGGDDASGRSNIHSAGVARMEIISARLTNTQRIILFASIFLIGYAYGLESQLRGTYTPYATASFGVHSYLATINVLRSVVAVAAQPTAAKIADVFGRYEVVAVSTVLYSVGIAIEATALSPEWLCLGTIIYQVGYTCIVLLMEVLIADFSSMRARVFFSYIPAMPFLINTWISGNITSTVLKFTTWRWGLGMWAIIVPVASLPLLIFLYIVEHRCRKHLDEPKMPFDCQSQWLLFHQLDFVGLFMIVGSCALILAPLTITGQKVDHWKDPHVLVPLAVGLMMVPIFVVWERRGALNPLIPFHLLTDRGVWAALAVRSLLNFAWYAQGNYLYTVLVVAFGFHIESATRITSLFSFFGVISGVLVGLVIYRIRRLKFIIVAGTCIFMIAFSVLIKFSGGASTSSQNGLLCAQVLLGLASGLFAYPTQASIQASATREHMAILTGLYLSFYNFGSALGTCLSGAIWTQTLLPTLQDNLSFQPNASLAEAIYKSPFSVVANYPVGTEIREAIIQSYSSVQRLLCIAGFCLCIPMIGFALALRNPKLTELQVQPRIREDEHDDEE